MENLETVLVTGGSGFVGSHCILQLLQKGYAVRTTLRSMQRKNKVLEMLKNGGITEFDRLSFVEADLNSDNNWDEAVAGCRYVLHVAFNIPIGRLAYLTGRSISAFKRDFSAVFNDTPNHWLVQRRLKEAYFLLDKKNKKPAEIYLDLGFENLSHFSYAFKKKFGLPPKEMGRR